MTTKAVEIPNPFLNPNPKHLFCADAKLMEEHRKLILSEAWQTSSKVAQAQMTRSILAHGAGKLDEPNRLQASALAFARLEGMNDFVNIFTSLAEIPPAPVAKKSPDNLDN